MSDWKGWTTIFCSEILGTSRFATFTSRIFFAPKEAGLTRSDGEPEGLKVCFLLPSSAGRHFSLSISKSLAIALNTLVPGTPYLTAWANSDGGENGRH